MHPSDLLIQLLPRPSLWCDVQRLLLAVPQLGSSDGLTGCLRTRDGTVESDLLAEDEALWVKRVVNTAPWRYLVSGRAAASTGSCNRKQDHPPAATPAGALQPPLLRKQHERFWIGLGAETNPEALMLLTQQGRL